MKPKLEKEFYPNGNLCYQEWFLKGKYHNEEGPAVIRYYNNGKVEYQSWFLNGKFHNEEGPAYIGYRADGNITHQEWCLKGKELSKEDFTSLDMIRKMNAFEFFSPIEIARFKINQNLLKIP